MWAPLSFALLLQLSSIVQAVDVISRKGDLHIINKDLSPDGFKRSTVLAGASANKASFPGPIIKANKGDTFEINVIDELTDPSMDRSTSIHWHGIHQHHTIWADGPTWVTQCPIVPKESFQYKFSVPDQAGTFWYHSHHRAQYCDGLRGAMVVYDPYDPYKKLYDVDDENTIITLSDWYHNTSTFLIQQPGPKIADSTLINGLGRWSNQPNGQLAVVNVEKGKRYRMRLVSLSCDPSYTFAIEGHNMTIIESDGQSTEPLAVDSLQIFAAQRYSFVLHANQPVGNYWIRANPSLGTSGFAGGINSAILRYKGAPNKEPANNATSPNGKLLNETDLRSQRGVPGKPVPGGADLVLNMTIGFIAPDTFTINDVPFVSPTTPVLLQILSGAQKPEDLLPSKSIYPLPRNKTIEINFSLSDPAGAPHPMHLHGHHFSVIKSADSQQYNFKNPVERDTVAVKANTTVAIRFRTDNSGPMFLHCHIEWHLVAGLAVILAEDTGDVRTENPVPPDWNKLCPNWNNTPADIRGEA
ncbi:hypothetical protein AAF712_003643 [Marasmius tenuissimus]|uniref:Laccase n=1 Tax=Marasmius tenuissimus TaxID=585030 RepID=A0ABR3A6R6_9AGAR